MIMPDFSRAKVGATIWFLKQNPPPEKQGPFSAVIDLLEYEHECANHSIKFWFGVADVACTLDELRAKVDSGFQHLSISLSEGRHGAAKQLRAYQSGPPSAPYTAIAFVGETALAIPSDG